MMLNPDQITKEPSSLTCNSCGLCCKDYAYVQLSQADVKRLEGFTGLAAEEFSDSSDKEGKLRFMSFQDNGDCVFLRTVNGAYSCGVYEARSDTCRNYPTTQSQIETCRRNSNR